MRMAVTATYCSNSCPESSDDLEHSFNTMMNGAKWDTVANCTQHNCSYTFVNAACNGGQNGDGQRKRSTKIIIKDAKQRRRDLIGKKYWPSTLHYRENGETSHKGINIGHYLFPKWASGNLPKILRRRRTSCSYHIGVHFTLNVQLIEGNYSDAVTAANSTLESTKQNLSVAFQDGVLNLTYGVHASPLSLADFSVLSPTNSTCPNGSVINVTSVSCDFCPEGSFHNLTNSRCQPCAIGQYQPEKGQLQCVQCPPWKSTFTEGTTDVDGCYYSEATMKMAMLLQYVIQNCPEEDNSTAFKYIKDQFVQLMDTYNFHCLDTEGCGYEVKSVDCTNFKLKIHFYILTQLGANSSSNETAARMAATLTLTRIRTNLTESFQDRILTLIGKVDGLSIPAEGEILVHYNITEPECPAGTVLNTAGWSCEPCDRGHYFNVTSARCDVCSRGSYQDSRGQTICHNCPSGTSTSHTGAINFRECIDENAITSTTDMTTTREMLTSSLSAVSSSRSTHYQSTLAEDSATSVISPSTGKSSNAVTSTNSPGRTSAASITCVFMPGTTACNSSGVQTTPDPNIHLIGRMNAIVVHFKIETSNQDPSGKIVLFKMYAGAMCVSYCRNHDCERFRLRSRRALTSSFSQSDVHILTQFQQLNGSNVTLAFYVTYPQSDSVMNGTLLLSIFTAKHSESQRQIANITILDASPCYCSNASLISAVLTSTEIPVQPSDPAMVVALTVPIIVVIAIIGIIIFLKKHRYSPCHERVGPVGQEELMRRRHQIYRSSSSEDSLPTDIDEEEDINPLPVASPSMRLRRIVGSLNGSLCKISPIDGVETRQDNVALDSPADRLRKVINELWSNSTLHETNENEAKSEWELHIDSY
ncbi:uncharacterized protein LOC106154766 isoform X2 [Lingula anatina]|nr:uncharacterized protein LOC106154766 isoform X2 [Lingula anatina]|eukprot:XP_013384689.1 uncharacterized protein LOC106154766 isoform X2 [Lingula anatina]